MLRYQWKLRNSSSEKKIYVYIYTWHYHLITAVKQWLGGLSWRINMWTPNCPSKPIKRQLLPLTPFLDNTCQSYGGNYYTAQSQLGHSFLTLRIAWSELLQSTASTGGSQRYIHSLRNTRNHEKSHTDLYTAIHSSLKLTCLQPQMLVGAHVSTNEFVHNQHFHPKALFKWATSFSLVSKD